MFSWKYQNLPAILGPGNSASGCKVTRYMASVTKYIKIAPVATAILILLSDEKVWYSSPKTLESILEKLFLIKFVSMVVRCLLIGWLIGGVWSLGILQPFLYSGLTCKLPLRYKSQAFFKCRQAWKQPIYHALSSSLLPYWNGLSLVVAMIANQYMHIWNRPPSCTTYPPSTIRTYLTYT